MGSVDRLADNGASSAGSKSLFNVEMTVAMLALQRDKKVAGADFARVKGNAVGGEFVAGLA